jgi:antitoxin (DNA-binding transcriptional repressor) of toxin-antitoxin stability system
MKSVTVHQLQANISAVLRDLPVTVVRYNKPIATIIPYLSTEAPPLERKKNKKLQSKTIEDVTVTVGEVDIVAKSGEFIATDEERIIAKNVSGRDLQAGEIITEDMVERVPDAEVVTDLPAPVRSLPPVIVAEAPTVKESAKNLTDAMSKGGVDLPDFSKDEQAKQPKKESLLSKVKKSITSLGGSSQYQLCEKHPWSMKKTCGCK